MFWERVATLLRPRSPLSIEYLPAAQEPPSVSHLMTLHTLLARCERAPAEGSAFIVLVRAPEIEALRAITETYKETLHATYHRRPAGV